MATYKWALVSRRRDGNEWVSTDTLGWPAEALRLAGEWFAGRVSAGMTDRLDGDSTTSARFVVGDSTYSCGSHGRGFAERATVAQWGGATIRALSTATTKPEGGHALVIAEHVIRAKSRRA